MQYYEVLVGHMTYHGSEALTYSSETTLQPGTIVKVSLRARAVLGIVTRRVPRPKFEVKPILAAAPQPPIPPEQLTLLRWIYRYYPAPLGAVVRLFVPPTDTLPRASANLTEWRGRKDPARAATASTTGGLPGVTRLGDVGTEPAGSPILGLPTLTFEQQNALHTISGPGTFLLHGVTGSGKSRVYIELAARALAQGKSALILTPEIGLTAQLTESFRQAFGTAVYVLHSRLTAAERRNIYYELLARTEPSVVIGPRSALFSPLRELGLVVLDEAHDHAYKNESAPHYHAARVAAKLAELHKATLVLGSATPSIEDYYMAQAKNRPIVTMQALAKQTDATLTIETVDMRETALFSRNRLLSNLLLEHIASAMQRGEQSLVFLNRRGTANVVLCSSCGWQSLCPHCDLPLTYHGDTHQLRCHICGFISTLPTSCPVCGEAEILFKSAGTKTVVTALQKLFPAARIQRFDTDAHKAERLEQHLSNLSAGSADIIVGTQMISKGLDLPKLSVVGIVNADSSLLIPDYTATEQTYQLVSQVVGRVGRGHRAGQVVVQTYDPTNATLQAALHRQWQTFYETELHERRSFRFPPFVHLLKLRVLRASSSAAEKVAEALTAALAQQYPGITVEGPAPSFHPRERGKYSWQLLVKSPARSTLVSIVSELPSGWSYDIDPINLL